MLFHVNRSSENTSDWLPPSDSKPWGKIDFVVDRWYFPLNFTGQSIKQSWTMKIKYISNENHTISWHSYLHSLHKSFLPKKKTLYIANSRSRTVWNHVFACCFAQQTHTTNEKKNRKIANAHTTVRRWNVCMAYFTRWHGAFGKSMSTTVATDKRTKYTQTHRALHSTATNNGRMRTHSLELTLSLLIFFLCSVVVVVVFGFILAFADDDDDDAGAIHDIFIQIFLPLFY